MPEATAAATAATEAKQEAKQEATSLATLPPSGLAFDKDEVIHRAKARHETRDTVFMIGALAWIVLLGVFLFFLTWIATVALAAMTLAFLIPFILIHPNSFVIHRDRLVMKGILWNINVNLCDITAAYIADDKIEDNCNLATSQKNRICIERLNAVKLYFSPEKSDEFLAFLQHAMNPEQHPCPSIGFERWDSTISVL